jgi:predicted AAA+ superfamily ATPase
MKTLYCLTQGNITLYKRRTTVATYRRTLEGTLTADLAIYPVVALVGARQVGKSTLARELASARAMAYVTLDDAVTRRLAQEAPTELLGLASKGGLCIDEVQRVPSLLFAVKQQVDLDGPPGRIILTGSNQPALGGAVGDSLAGRAAYRTLRPLVQAELRFSEEQDAWSVLASDATPAILLRYLEDQAALNAPTSTWQDVVRIGGFPRVVNAPPNAATRLLDDYLQAFVRRDIREILNVDSTERFEAFVRLLFARTGQELNLNGMSRDLGASVSTLRRWWDAVARSYMVEAIPAFSRNAGERVIKAPKAYAVDVGLAIAGARETEPSGFHLETLIASDLLRWRDAAPGRLISHWRLGSGQEVDFIVQHHAQLVAVEVKATAHAEHADARHLRTFAQKVSGVVRSLLLSNDPQVRVMSGGVIAAPWWSVV